MASAITAPIRLTTDSIASDNRPTEPVKYHAAARLNELVAVSAEVVKIGRASVAFRQLVERAGELLVEAEITLAVVDKGRMKPARMPIELEQALK